MRQVWGDQRFLDFTPMDPVQVEELKVLDQVIQKADRVLGLVAADLTTGIDSGTGRPGMSAEQVLRMAIVKQMNEWSYDELYARVHDSVLLRKFCRYEFDLPPKPSTLQENIKKIRPETFEAVNRALLGYAKKEGVEDGKKIRIDSTPVETNIHYPTDSSLLWDGVRVLTRMLASARRVFPMAGITFHNRTRVVKKLAYAIANAKNEETRKPLYREMLTYAEEVLGYADEGVKKLRELCGTDEAKAAARMTARDIVAMADLVRQVIDQTRRRVIQEERVPAGQKVVSLFEPETNIIEKGGAGDGLLAQRGADGGKEQPGAGLPDGTGQSGGRGLFPRGDRSAQEDLRVRGREGGGGRRIRFHGKRTVREGPRGRDGMLRETGGEGAAGTASDAGDPPDVDAVPRGDRGCDIGAEAGCGVGAKRVEGVGIVPELRVGEHRGAQPEDAGEDDGGEEEELRGHRVETERHGTLRAPRPGSERVEGKAMTARRGIEPIRRYSMLTCPKK